MRKVYLALLALGMTGMLAACGGSGNSGYVIKEGDSVLTEQFMQANYNENVYAPKKVSFETYEVDMEGYTKVSEGLSEGYAVYQKDGKYGVYSFFGKKFIVEPRLTTQPVPAHFLYDSVFGFDFIYQEPSNEHWYIVDGAGNVIAESKEQFNVDYINKSYITQIDDNNNEALYCQWSYRDADPLAPTGNQYAYFKYDANQVATKVTFADYNESEGKQGEHPEDGRAYDLSKEGLDIVVRIFGTRSTGFTIKINDKAGEEKGSFLFAPGNYNSDYFFAGKRLYLIRINMIDGRYTLTNNYIDLEKVEIKDFNNDIAISSIKKLQSVENTEHTYFATTFKEIYSDGTSGMTRTMIMDEKGDFHDDITHKNFVEWVRLSNGYFYNEAQDELYNSDFKFVASTRGYYFSARDEVFYDYDDATNGYLILNSEGKFIADTGKYLFQYSDPILNGVYSVVSIDPYEEGFYNANTNKYFKLENTKDTEKSKVEVEESYGSGTILRVERTYPDEERTQPEETAKRKASLRTVDGQSIIEIPEKFGSMGCIDFSQQYVRNPIRVLIINYTVNSEVHRVYGLSREFKVQTIAAPAATAA